MVRYIFVTGGVSSSLGKGVLSASLGALLKARGYKIRIKKMDPYLNVDPGTMNPYEHGEVFITEDGTETDMDIGHYERFAEIICNKYDTITTGKIYDNIISKERKGDFLGSTIQVIPHVTNEIKSFVDLDVSKDTDFVICEIGGTTGDIESTPFVESIRQFIIDKGSDHVVVVHLTLLPYLPTSGELKTKPTQHSVKEMRALGVNPNIIVCRSLKLISDQEKEKISLFCSVNIENVIAAYDANNIYKVPVAYHKEGLDIQVLKHFNYPSSTIDLSKWEAIQDKLQNLHKDIVIAFIGKYVGFKDSYKSLLEAINHAAIADLFNVTIKWVDAELIESSDTNLAEIFANVDGTLVAPGFGTRGTKGKIKAIRFIRENNIPFLGICFGFQMAVIEFARNVLGIKDAMSTEISPKGTPVISFMDGWVKSGSKETRDLQVNKGGTMRLGAYPCVLKPSSLASKIYNGASVIQERHRHRYEVNYDYIKKLFSNTDMRFSGVSPDGILMEILELTNHPWFLAVQYHPELQSRIFEPHPIFINYLNACYQYSLKSKKNAK